MRIFRGLENIHSVIDRHESEWRRDNGEETEHIRRPSIEEAVRRRLTAQPDMGSGMFAADRFLGGSTDPLKRKSPEPVKLKKPEPEPVNVEPEINVEPETTRHSWLYNEVMKAVNVATAGSENTKVVAVFVPVIRSEGVAREIPADSDALPDEGENVRAVEIIRNKDGRHSRLYDEVMRAVNDAAGDSRRIVAVFVPLLQDGGEFEDLPADETLTLSPVSEDDVKVEAVPDTEPAIMAVIPEPETVPDIAAEPEAESAPEIIAVIPEPETEAAIMADFPEPEQVPDIALEPEAESVPEIIAVIPEPEQIPDIAPEPEAESVPEIITVIPESEPAQEIIAPEPKITADIPETESEPEAPSKPEDFDLIPEVQQELDPELAEAFREMEQKLDEATQQEITAPEIEPEYETETDYDDDILQDGEPMVFEELDDIGRNDADNVGQTEELVLPDELDDDEINDDFDETLTEIQLPDDDDDEIEIVPDPAS